MVLTSASIEPYHFSKEQLADQEMIMLISDFLWLGSVLQFPFNAFVLLAWQQKGHMAHKQPHHVHTANKTFKKC